MRVARANRVSSESLSVTVGHPMPTHDHAVLLASYGLLLDLSEERVRVRVTPTEPTSFFEDWEVTRAAFMARMAATLRHLGFLAPSYSRLEGVALARTLPERVLCSKHGARGRTGHQLAPQCCATSDGRRVAAGLAGPPGGSRPPRPE